MKLELDAERRFSFPTANGANFKVEGESDTLARVLLCAPDHLQAVPCCSVTKESLRTGFSADGQAALRQHAGLRAALQAHGVAVQTMPATPGLPDSCFTRDVGVATPWGLVALNPALEHRAPEVRQFQCWAAAHGAAPVRQITEGRIEGGDVCVARPGLLILGVSGHRTDLQGAHAFAAPFRAAGWDVIEYQFDEHFLHFDTIFTMLTPRLALGCTEVLDDAFLADVQGRGIEVLPVSYKEARRLGCNVVSIDGRTILAGAATPRVSAMMRAAGLQVIELDLSQFSACGGGVHCLTMPLLRVAQT